MLILCVIILLTDDSTSTRKKPYLELEHMRVCSIVWALGFPRWTQAPGGPGIEHPGGPPLGTEHPGGPPPGIEHPGGPGILPETIALLLLPLL